MHLPPLQLINSACFLISGNVTIHPGATIAPNVLLQADPGSQLIVNAGVCVGQGTVLHAHQGTLEVEAGATLGSGVLVIGHGRIGAQACIGAMTTIIDSSIEPKQLIPPGSLIGDKSRPVAPELQEPDVTASAGGVKTDSSQTPQPSQSAQPAQPSPQPSAQPSAQSAPESSKPKARPSAAKKPLKAYGQAYIERMMITMFPHSRILETADSSSEQPDASDSTGSNSTDSV